MPTYPRANPKQMHPRKRTSHCSLACSKRWTQGRLKTLQEAVISHLDSRSPWSSSSFRFLSYAKGTGQRRLPPSCIAELQQPLLHHRYAGPFRKQRAIWDIERVVGMNSWKEYYLWMSSNGIKSSAPADTGNTESTASSRLSDVTPAFKYPILPRFRCHHRKDRTQGGGHDDED